MNWQFHAVTNTDSAKMIKEYSALAEEAIEFWLASHEEPTETQKESDYTEFPQGFHHEGVSYKFRFRMGYWDKAGYVSMSPAEYDVTVEQTYYPEGAERLQPRKFWKRRYFRESGPVD